MDQQIEHKEMHGLMESDIDKKIKLYFLRSNKIRAISKDHFFMLFPDFFAICICSKILILHIEVHAQEANSSILCNLPENFCTKLQLKWLELMQFAHLLASSQIDKTDPT